MGEQTPDIPDMRWDAKKEDIDAVTGRHVEPIEETPEERERLTREAAELYKAHHPEESGEELPN